MFGRKTYVVGKDISAKDISEFYWTRATSANPPLFLRYRFFAEDGKYAFYHETREGESWPLTEKDITDSGTLKLSESSWCDEFFGCLEGGKVTRRIDDPKDGGTAPEMFIYWTKDKGKFQVFSFENAEKEALFNELCRALVLSLLVK